MTGVVFLTEDFEPASAPVDDFTSLIWANKYYQNGSFKLTLPIARYKYIKGASYVYNPDNGGCAIFSRLNLMSENGTVTPGGFLLEALLDRRTITVETKLTGDLETEIRALVTATAITSPRTIAHLALATAIGYTDTVDTSIEVGTRLSDALYAILKPYGMSYRITLDYATGTLLFSVVKGLNRTQSQSINSRAVFSTDFENLQGIEYLHNDDDYSNFAYVTGSNSILGDVTIEVDQSDGSERRETFINANVSSKKADNTDMSLAEYQALLATIGAEALADNKAIDNVSGDIDTAGSLKYHTNYNLGDLCDVVATEQNLAWTAQITGVDEVYEKGGKRIVPIFGDAATDIVGLIKREAKKNGAFGSSVAVDTIVITALDEGKRITGIDLSSFTEIYPCLCYSYDNLGPFRNINSIIFKNNITVIGEFAFTYCAYLETLSLPDTIKRIERSAFETCYSLILTQLPRDLEYIGNFAFYDCYSLAITAFPAGLQQIGENAFTYCETLSKVWIPISCTTIAGTKNYDGIFSDCSSSLKIYCEAASKPAGWNQYWNNRTTTIKHTTYWGISKAAFDAL